MEDGAPALIHIVEDHTSTRTALARLLRAFGYVVIEYASALEFQRRPRTAGPECALMDVQLPGLSGLELQQALADTGDPMPVVFLTGHADIPMSVQAMKLGAVDFLTKPADQSALLQAVRRALARSSGEREGRARLQELRARFATLTPREREVFAQVVTGKLNKQIAYDLGTVERTIKAHRHQVMEKMQANSLADLVRMADALELAGLEKEVVRVATQLDSGGHQ
jgi:FixJ family two-component response regulator